MEEISASRSASLPPKKDSLAPIEWEAGWFPETVWTFWRGDKFLFPAGIRTLRRPARNLVTTTFFTLTLLVQELQDWKSMQEESSLCQLHQEVLIYSTFFHSFVSFPFIIGHTLIKHYLFRYTQWTTALFVLSANMNFFFKIRRFQSKCLSMFRQPALLSGCPHI